MPLTFQNITEITNAWTQLILVEIYKKSQEIVPTKSGALKSSGGFKYGQSGSGTITYDAPHADKIGGGAPKSQSGTGKVSGYKRTLSNGKSVMVRNYTRQVPKKTNTASSKSSRGNFLDKAMEEVMADSKLLERLWLQVGGGSTPVIESEEQ
jgi:hypothetical protein